MGEATGPDARTLVFAYGSNLDEARMVGRVPSARVVGRSSLPGHELRFHKRGWKDGTGKANAFETGRGDAVVYGVVYDVAEVELADLDVHETGYDRVRLPFELADGADPRTVQAWIYIARPETIDEELKPRRWYVDHVLRGARAHGLSEELLEMLGMLEAEE